MANIQHECLCVFNIVGFLGVDVIFLEPRFDRQAG